MFVMKFIFLTKLLFFWVFLANFCFPENLLAVAANRCKVLKTFISIKVTVCTQDRRLQSGKPKMPRVLSGNLIVLKWQNIHMISNIKYITIYSKIWPRTLLYIQQRRIQNPFKCQKQSPGGVL